MESNQVISEIKDKFSGVEVTGLDLIVPAEDILPVTKKLRDEFGFNFLTNQTAVDYTDHFELIYHVCGIPKGEILTIRVKVDRNKAEIHSVCEIWPGALWQEREIYDLLGIVFINHPDLRRILLSDCFEGHPLRKDFKWVGGRDQ